MVEIKTKIQDAVKNFNTGNLTEASLNIFKTLGYPTDRQNQFSQKTYQIFKDSFLEGDNGFNEQKALAKTDWKYIDLLFQISEEEVKGIKAGRFNDKDIHSFLFFAIELTESDYSRTALSQITREVNKVFPMPVMILFKYGSALTLSIINRRLHKKDEQKDVLEKVTLIKDINIENPHRAHIEILFDLSFDELLRKYKVTNFVELHNGWQKTLDTKELNKRFYQELFNWYLWALKIVKFPQIRPAEDLIDDKVHQSESLIRLLTRLLFCWFMKEKGLIKEDLFNITNLKNILEKFQGLNSNETIYYKAILQNLFFATLSKPIADRKVIKNVFPNPEYGDPLIYRYGELFKNENDILKHFQNIPFLNGGLFDCLDSRKDTNNPFEIRLDGFSKTKSKQPIVSDNLFFGEYKEIDLSTEYDDKKKSKVTVYGIIDILYSYKFTIEENTPIEEEIALDPELLGKVFENLLASYNQETQTTARKQTGSFYTPREIVNYMVDESLKAYFLTILDKNSGQPQGLPLQNYDRLCYLFSYTDEPHQFNKNEVDILITAIDKCKILDPACGSGAFPMGVLQKLIHILRKIDPENKQWFEIVINKFPVYMQNEMRGKLKHENWDYVRKLGIIQECIYGVDIQPIAIQISKLRFFISLLVDQKEKPGEENRGFEPLPNLDFKLVAANTLIGAPKSDIIINTSLFDGLTDDPFFDKFDEITEQYFSAYTPDGKKRLKSEISLLITKKCREKIKTIENLSTHNDARYSKALAEKNKKQIEEKEREVNLWNSYQNLFKHEAAGFFEPRYFFPKVKDGFDVVIGNPPYMQIQNFSGMQQQADWARQKYETYVKTGDVYCLFYERGVQLLKPNGILTFITSNKWMRANYGKNLRHFFVSHTNPQIIVDFENHKVFESATVNTNILIVKRAINKNILHAVTIGNDFTETTSIYRYFNKNSVILNDLSEDSWLISSNEEYAVKKRIEAVGTPLKDWDIAIYRGILTGLNEAFIIDGKKKDELIALDPRSVQILKPILRGRDIKRYGYEWAGLWLIFIPWHFPLHKGETIQGVSIKAEKEFEIQYPAIYRYILQFKDSLTKRNKEETGIRYEWYALQRCAATYYSEFEKDKISWGNLAISAQFAFVKAGTYINAPSPLITPANKYLLAILNSRVGDYYIRSLGVIRNGGYFEYKPMFVEKLPVPMLTLQQQLPFECLVDCILFAKKNDFTQESDLFESVIDGMVYDLYFSEEMKNAHCYITDRVAEVVKPFKSSDTDGFKTEYIKTLFEFFRKDPAISHGLIHSRAINVIKIINGG